MLDYDYDDREPFEIEDLYENNAERDYVAVKNSYDFYSSEMKDALTQEQEQELMSRIKNGDEDAYREFFDRNIKLVFYVAKNFSSDSMYYEYDDAVQEGMFGLMKAIDEFDPSKGYRFSTYAINWIRSYISRARSQKYLTIRVPTHLWDLSRKCYSMKKSREDKGLSVSNEDMRKELGVSEGRYELAKIIANPKILSLDDTITNYATDSSMPLKEILVSDLPSPEDIAVKHDNARVVNESLSCLTSRESQIIKESYGLDGHKKKTVRQISEELHISHQRVFQVQKRAIEKLRAYPKIQAIAD